MGDKPIEYFVLDNQRLLISVVIGQITAEKIFDSFRRCVAGRPELMNFAQIYDFRRWRGTATDEEMAAQREWNRDFRVKNGLAHAQTPVAVYLVTGEVTWNSIANRLGRVSRKSGPPGHSVVVTHRFQDAWQAAVGRKPMPQGLAKLGLNLT